MALKTFRPYTPTNRYKEQPRSLRAFQKEAREVPA